MDVSWNKYYGVTTLEVAVKATEESLERDRQERLCARQQEIDDKGAAALIASVVVLVGVGLGMLLAAAFSDQ